MLNAILTLANEKHVTSTIIVGWFEICHRLEGWGCGYRVYRVTTPLSPKYITREDTARLLMLHGVTRGEAAPALAVMRLGV